MPILIAIMFSGFWNIINTNIRRMEPFFQLNTPGGARGTDTFAFGYLDANCFTAPYLAFVSHHWAVFLSSIINLVAGLAIPVLSCQAIFIGADGDCRLDSDNRKCTGYLSTNALYIRALQACLTFVGLSAIALTWVVSRRKSGISADPTTIAGLACIFERHPVLEHLRHTHPYATSKEIHQALQYNLYDIMPNSVMYPEYGPGGIPAPPPYRSGDRYIPLQDNSFHGSPDGARMVPRSRRGHLHWASIFFFGLALLALLGTIGYYRIRGEDTAFERFFNSNGPGPRAVMAAAGCLIRFYWQDAERSTLLPTP